MCLYLVLLFTVVPLLELTLLIQVDRLIGLPATIGLVLATGVLGAALARWQGVLTLLRIRSEMSTGKMPADALLDGLLILVAGAVLLTPGILTDAVGFALLIPPLRRVVKQWLKKSLAGRVRLETTQFSGQWSGLDTDDGIIEARATKTHVVDDQHEDTGSSYTRVQNQGSGTE